MRKILQWVLILCYLIMARAANAASDRHVVFISDLHVGAGQKAKDDWHRIEDFRWQDEFNLFLAHIGKRGKDQVDLVLLGDVFELWQSPAMECSNDLTKPGCHTLDCNDTDSAIGCTETEALERLKIVLDRHPAFVMALSKFAARGSNRVVIVPGNHDAALTFPALRQLLAERAGSPNVAVEAKGHWLSSDGVIYGDHGHQFDELNMFPNWPQPFIKRAGTQYLFKPWGENMVQRFYNQYEAVYPIIDNLTDEKAGVSYAVKQAGFVNTTAAIRRFVRFFLYEQSVQQVAASLGDDGKMQWDYSDVRTRLPAFFLDILPAEQRSAGLETGFAPQSLLTFEIDAICSAKAAQPGTARCPDKGKVLGAGLTSAMSNLKDQQRTYLRQVLPKLTAAGHVPASVYVYGHTHNARPPTTVQLGEMSDGSRSAIVANTGAFQRTATPAQIDRIIASAAGQGRRPLDLMPEDLPPCYTFVLVEPYTGRKAKPVLYRWAKDGTTFKEASGSCQD